MRNHHIYAVASTSVLAIAALPQPAFAQIADSWSISGDTTVTASNTDAAVSVTQSTDGLISGAAIADGSRNTISASAIGATASVTSNATAFQDLTIADSVDGSVLASASNLNSPITVTGTIDDATITQGHDNSISVSTVGASAQLGITDAVLGGVTVSHSLTVSGDVTLYAENTSAITLQADIGTNGSGPQITGGTRNTFSANAVGASAGVSVLAVVDDGTYASDIAIADGGLINVTAINSGDVTIGSIEDPSQAATLNGALLGADSVDGNISMMAIGASGAVTSTAVVYAGSAEPNVTFGDATFDVENSGSVSANVTISDLSIDGNNTISVGAVGTSVSNAVRYISYAGDGIAVTSTLGMVNFNSSNAGSVYVSGGIANAAITGGMSVAISTSAIGAAASFILP